MIKIIDTYSRIGSLFENDTFNMEKWELYIDSIYADSASVFKDGLAQYINSGKCSYEEDILPIIQSATKTELD